MTCWPKQFGGELVQFISSLLCRWGEQLKILCTPFFRNLKAQIVKFGGSNRTWRLWPGHHSRQCFYCGSVRAREAFLLSSSYMTLVCLYENWFLESSCIWEHDARCTSHRMSTGTLVNGKSSCRTSYLQQCLDSMFFHIRFSLQTWVRLHSDFSPQDSGA